MTPGQEHAAREVVIEMIRAGLPSHRIEELVTALLASSMATPFAVLTGWVRRVEEAERTALIDAQIKRAVYALERRDFKQGIPALDEADRLKSGQRPL